MNLMSELEQIRVSSGWTDEEMADEMGISRAMYSMVRSGKRRPGRQFLAAVKGRFKWLDLNYYFASDSHYSNNPDTKSDTTKAEADDAAA